MAEKMKAVLEAKPQPGAELREVNIPEVGPTDVLIRVRATSVCGTDLRIYERNQWAKNRIKPPEIVGHDKIGIIEEIGECADSINVGVRY